MSLSADDVDAVVVDDGCDDHDTTDHCANVQENKPRSEKRSRFFSVV